MNRQQKNQLRKKIENYSYGLSDQIDLAKKGNIFKGVNQLTEEKVAIKVIDLRKKQSDPTLKDQLAVEIEALKKLKHPNIIRCFDIFSTVNNCYIITEFCEGGDLENRIKTRGPFRQPQALVPFKDLIAGYLTMAHEKYAHGGLKLSSLLLKENTLKITGFSNCKKTNKPDLKREVQFNPYQSPQSIKQHSFTQKSDIWSLGMILYVLLHGQFPWVINQPLDIVQNCIKPYTMSPDLSAQVKDFINRSLQPFSTRLSIQQLPSHQLIKKFFSTYSPQKYILGVIGNEVLQQQRNKKQNQNIHLNRVQKHIGCQINWMRFLFRVLQRFANVSEEINTITTLILKFIVLRQLSVQFQSLKRHFELGQNVFSLTNWQEFTQQKERMAKLRDIIHKNEPRYEKAKTTYQKLLQQFSSMNPNIPSLKGMSQLLNYNFTISEYNCIFAVSAATAQIRRLWQKISKDYNLKSKYDKDMPFKYRNELLLLDFAISYYQLNCIYIDDFHRQDYFEKMSKLDVILEYQPVELDASHLEMIQQKMGQLGILL